MEQEWQIRKNRINRRLKAQGWQLMPWIDGLSVDSLSGVAVTEFPTANGSADYGLFVDGCLLGILERSARSVANSFPVTPPTRRRSNLGPLFANWGNMNRREASRLI